MEAVMIGYILGLYSLKPARRQASLLIVISARYQVRYEPSARPKSKTVSVTLYHWRHNSTLHLDLDPKPLGFRV